MRDTEQASAVLFAVKLHATATTFYIKTLYEVQQYVHAISMDKPSGPWLLRQSYDRGGICWNIERIDCKVVGRVTQVDRATLEACGEVLA